MEALSSFNKAPSKKFVQDVFVARFEGRKGPIPDAEIASVAKELEISSEASQKVLFLCFILTHG